MTRFARYFGGKKPAHDATKWSEMKSGGNQQSENGYQKQKTEQADHSSPLKQVKTENMFKRKKNQTRKEFQTKGKKDFSSMKCYNCGNFGHKVSTCPEPPDGKMLDVECYSCKGKGHKAFQCPSDVHNTMKGMNKRFEAKETTQKVKESFEAENTDWKEQRSEGRRLKRIHNHVQRMRCFNCRGTGHRYAECPELEGDVEHGADVCMKCGSTEHQYKLCKAKLPEGVFPFAKCFICKEKGHLSSKCPDNPRGIYPDGGCCNLCGSVEHLRHNCPVKQEQDDAGKVSGNQCTGLYSGGDYIKLERLEEDASADQDVTMVTEDDDKPSDDTKKPKKPKVVKF